MKRTLLILAGAIVILAAGWWTYDTYIRAGGLPTSADQQEVVDEEIDDLENVIWASGKLEPRIWADLSLIHNGMVSQIYVSEGDWVEVDQVLLEIDAAVLRSAVNIAVAQVAEAQAGLDKLRAGATVAQIAAAEADVQAAEAAVAQAAGQMLETQSAIEAAAARVRMAQRTYTELDSHPNQPELTVALAESAVAQAALTQAKAAYNEVRGDPKIGMRLESRALYEATAGVEVAHAQYALIEQGATPQELAVAWSAVEAAQVDVEAARSRGPSAEANVRSAMAGQASAQAALDNLLAGATREEIAMAEAKVQSARAVLASAEAQLRQCQIVAPYAGQVGAINVRTGEMVTPGQPLLLFGDAHEMHVKTTDLRETDVVRLAENMSVELTFDALPDDIFNGTIMRIAPVSSAEKGSTNYTVQIDVDDLDERLRWGMTAFVNIQAP